MARRFNPHLGVKNEFTEEMLHYPSGGGPLCSGMGGPLSPEYAQISAFAHFTVHM